MLKLGPLFLAFIRVGNQMSADIKKLPFIEIVGLSISFAFNNLGLMVRLSWLWGIGVGIASGLLIFMLIKISAGWDSDALGILDFVAVVAPILFYVAAVYAIAIGWHRALLLEERPRWFSLSFGPRELKYIGYAFLIGIVSMLPFALGFLIFGTVPTGDRVAANFVIYNGALLGGFMLMLLIFVRLFLVLPGIAVGDRRISLAGSIYLTRGNAWRIAGGFLLISVLNIVPNILLPDLDPNAAIGPSQVFLILVFVFSVLFSIVLAFVAVSYMSYCYWFFVSAPGEGDLA